MALPPPLAPTTAHAGAPARQRSAAAIAWAIEHFDRLPDSALVPLQVVSAIRGRSHASIWRDVRAGRLPAPVNAGPRCTRWRVGDLRGA